MFNDESENSLDEKLKSRAEAKKCEKEHELIEKVSWGRVGVFQFLFISSIRRKQIMLAI